MDTAAREAWASGAAYEPYVGRWSRLVAHQFLAWLNVPASSRWLDLGCGTGALTQTVLDLEHPAHVLGMDASAGYISFVRDHIRDARATFLVADALSLPADAGSFDAAVSGLMLNFVPRAELAVAEMVRVVKPGGVVAAYVWDYAGKMQMMRYFWDAAVALNPAARDLDEGQRFPMCKPQPLEEMFRGAGLAHVEVRPIDVPTHFRNFNDYWSPFEGAQGPAPGYAMSLPEDRRTALRDYIHARLPIAHDGSIDLVARAWAVQGHIRA
jgi:SAM-dependent methyltransferase